MRTTALKALLALAFLLSPGMPVCAGEGTFSCGFLTPATAPPGESVYVTVELTTNGAQAASLVFDLTYDPARLTPVAIRVNTGAAQKEIDYEAQAGVLTIVVYGGVLVLGDGPLLDIAFCVSPDAGVGEAVALPGGSVHGASPDAAHLAGTFLSGQIDVVAGTAHHSADTAADWHISLSELLRLIQFFNTGSYHREAGTEDGFAPFAGDQSCAPHDSDYAPQDWSIDLSELLRMIQFFNSPEGSYHLDAGGEDGFAAGPA